MDIIKKIAEELQIKATQAEAAVKLIDEGCTIPFIARYRKEATGALNDEQLRNLDERLRYLRNLEVRKEEVISSIEEQGKLTDELKQQILAAETMVLVEDLYRPYKQKRRTRATIAKEKGIEPLHREGRGNGSNWVVLDYADIIVHVFCKDTREFYQLERLWADGEPVDISQWTKPNGIA